MNEERKRKWWKIFIYFPMISLVLLLVAYFAKPTFIVDFFHLGIDRDEITLKEKEKTPRQKLLNKWSSLESQKELNGVYPAFQFTSDELQIFVQEMYKHALTEEIKGIETTLNDDEITLRLKLNLSKYEDEIKKSGTPEIASMLKEDIVLSVKGGIKQVINNKVEVDIKSIHFGFIPLPMSFIDRIVNSEDNVKKYGRAYDYKKYPLPRGINNLKIKDSILYVN